MELEKIKRTRNKKTNFETSYCFSLSKIQLIALKDFSKKENKSISKVIRESITNQINKKN
jgi:hypothetical protein